LYCQSWWSHSNVTVDWPIINTMHFAYQYSFCYIYMCTNCQCLFNLLISMVFALIFSFLSHQGFFIFMIRIRIGFHYAII
jgi:hypothetical protein